MSDTIRIECPSCGSCYTEGQQRADCPHEYTSSFTRAMVEQVRRRLRNDEQ